MPSDSDTPDRTQASADTRGRNPSPLIRTQPQGSQPTRVDVAWPAWTEAHRVDDAAFAAAYEAVGPKCRAAVKTAAAMYFRYDESAREVVHESRSDHISGFWRTRTVFPAPWAIVAITPRYTAAARLLAALMPAVISGVRLVGCVCVDGLPSDPCLATLELAGVTDVFVLSAAELSALLEETQPGPGRLVLLHTGRLDVVGQQARVLHLPCFEERRAPVLTIPRPELFDLDVLRFAQGTEAVQRALQSPSPAAPDVLYASREAVTSHCLAHVRTPFSLGMAPLALAPGCEGFWLHHGLGRSFFLAHRVGFGLEDDGAAGDD